MPILHFTTSKMEAQSPNESLSNSVYQKYLFAFHFTACGQLWLQEVAFKLFSYATILDPLPTNPFKVWFNPKA